MACIISPNKVRAAIMRFIELLVSCKAIITYINSLISEGVDNVVELSVFNRLKFDSPEVCCRTSVSQPFFNFLTQRIIAPSFRQGD